MFNTSLLSAQLFRNRHLVSSFLVSSPASEYRSSLIYIPQRNVAAAPKEIPVILTKTISNVGFQGEIIKVKKGFARNFLFPRSLAEYPTPDTIRRYGANVAEQRALLEQTKLQQQAQKRLKKLSVLMKRHEMPDGSFHSPVSVENIIEKLEKQHRIKLEREQVLTDAAFTTYGKHSIRVMLNGVQCDLSIKIDPR